MTLKKDYKSGICHLIVLIELLVRKFVLDSNTHGKS